MSGGIIPKRGLGTPGVGVLSDGELGVSIDQRKIYLGVQGKSPVPIGGVTEISPYANTYTELSRYGHALTIYFRNLQEGKTYSLWCFTRTRKGGNKTGDWYHPKNFSATDGRIGYGVLAGTPVDLAISTGYFQEVPPWMPNNGYLQTEWAIGTSGYLTINLCSWFTPMCKPCSEEKGTSLDGVFKTHSILKDNYIARTIGVGQNPCAGKLFQFRLVDEDGIIYPSQDTLSIGHTKNHNAYPYFLIEKSSSGNTYQIVSSSLFSSII